MPAGNVAGRDRVERLAGERFQDRVQIGEILPPRARMKRSSLRGDSALNPGAGVSVEGRDGGRVPVDLVAYMSLTRCSCTRVGPLVPFDQAALVPKPALGISLGLIVLSRVVADPVGTDVARLVMAAALTSDRPKRPSPLPLEAPAGTLTGRSRNARHTPLGPARLSIGTSSVKVSPGSGWVISLSSSPLPAEPCRATLQRATTSVFPNARLEVAAPISQTISPPLCLAALPDAPDCHFRQGSKFRIGVDAVGVDDTNPVAPEMTVPSTST